MSQEQERADPARHLALPDPTAAPSAQAEVSSHPTTLGGWLAYLRRRAHWTQVELAEAAQLATETISHIERGVVRAARGRGRGADGATRALLTQALRTRFAELAQARGSAQWLPPEEAAELSGLAAHLLSAAPGPAPHRAKRPGAPPPAPSAGAGATVRETPLPGPGLPAPPTVFVGRVREREAVMSLLARPEVRLLTLVGPGGVGKTRLALQIATEVAATRATRAAEDQRGYDSPAPIVVALATVREAALVLPAIAQALGLREEGGQAPLAAVQDALAGRPVLLLLDNCEQVRDAAPDLAALFAACPRLQILATSRAPWHVQGEYEYALEPLALPAPGEAAAETVAASEAVALFVTRGQAVRSGFTLNAATALAVTEICRRLDGLPLALELAAAQLKVLTPRTLLSLLERRLPLLVGGPRDAPERQRTLRATLVWSYDLLSAAEQALFRRLGVFAGGCSLAALQAVCGGGANLVGDLLQWLGTLVDHSLLRAEEQADGETRIMLLETIHEYALERLEASSEAEGIRRAHAAYYLALAEEAAPELVGPDQVTWIRRLEAEHDNLRVALRWARESGERETGLRLAGALYRFWDVRGYLSEGRRWLDELLADAETSTRAEVTATVRAKALYAASVLAYYQSDYERAEATAEEALALSRAADDRCGMAAALMNLGNVALDQGAYPRAADMYERALALWRALGDRVGLGIALDNLALLARNRGEYARAATLAEESLALQRALGNQRGVARALATLGLVARDQGEVVEADARFQESLTIKRQLGDPWEIAVALASLSGTAHQRDEREAATALAEESLALFERVGDTWGRALALRNLGRVALDEGEWARAARLYGESLALSQTTGDTFGLPVCLEALAELASTQGQHTRAARLYGAIDTLRETIGAPRPPSDRASYDNTLGAARAALGEDALTDAWAAGQALPLERAVAEALQTTTAKDEAISLSPLTPGPSPSRGEGRTAGDAPPLPRQGEGAGGEGFAPTMQWP